MSTDTPRPERVTCVCGCLPSAHEEGYGCPCGLPGDVCSPIDRVLPERVTLTADAELEVLARVIRDAGISGVTGDHVGPFDLARADAVLSSDWLAAREQALREEIAGEIEARAVASFDIADAGFNDGLARAARIARGGAR